MADSGDRIGILLNDFGERVGLGDLALDETGYCCLLLGERILIDLDYDAGEERLLLSAFLGRPSAAASGSLQAQLLGANFLGQGTGGGALSLHEASGGVVLWRQLSVAALDLARLESAIEAFVASAERWIDVIAEGPEGATMEPMRQVVVDPGVLIRA